MTLLASNKQTHIRRHWLYALLLCVLLRSFVPVGFMAGSAQAGVAWSWISLCLGNSGSAQLLAIAAPDADSSGTTEAHDQPHHRLAAQQDHEHATQSQPSDHQQVGHTYCLYAGVSFDGLQTSASDFDPAFAAQPLLAPTGLSHHNTLQAVIPPARAPPVTPRIV